MNGSPVFSYPHQYFTIARTWKPRGFPGGSDAKEFAHNAEDPGLFLGSRRSPEGGHGNPFQITIYKLCEKGVILNAIISKDIFSWSFDLLGELPLIMIYANLTFFTDHYRYK